MAVNPKIVGAAVAGVAVTAILGLVAVRQLASGPSEPSSPAVRQPPPLPPGYFDLGDPPKADPPRIVLDKQLALPPIDLGQGQTEGEGVLRIRNEGPGASELSKVELHGTEGFAMTDLCPSVLEEGGECEIVVTFSGIDAGTSRGSIELQFDGRPKTVRLRADVLAPYTPPPAPPPAPPEPDKTYLSWAEWRAQVLAGRANGGPGFVREGVLEQRNISLPETDPDRYELTDDDYGALREDESTLPVDRTRRITQDKIIWAVLRTPINTQIGGWVLATVDEHVFGGDGRLKLLPKGTQLIGEYKPLEQTGDSRLEVKWTRLLRPDGASISFEGLGGDAMGRNGLIGDLDNRTWEKYGTAFITTLLSAAIVAASSSAPDENISQASDQFSQNLGQVTAQVLEKQIDLAPVVSIAAGERILIKPLYDIAITEPRILAARSAQAGAKKE